MLRQIDQNFINSSKTQKLWFTDESLDLFLWLSCDQEVIHFQFAYDKPNDEKLLHWSKDTGLVHRTIDDGSKAGNYPSSPILIDNAPLDKQKLTALLESQTQAIPSEYYTFIKKIIMDAP